MPEEELFIGISNSDYSATVEVLLDEYGIPFIRPVCEEFKRSHELVENIKKQITKYFKKNNEADFEDPLYYKS